MRINHLLIALLLVVLVPRVTKNHVAEVDQPIKQATGIIKPLEGKVYAQKEELATIPIKAVVAAPVQSVAQAQPTDNSDAKSFIYSHESGNRTSAINASSGACGLGQALPCSKMGCSLSDYACQDAFFTNYAMQRYGSWENAKAWWLVHSWW
jgi:hypothetical protein